jgi:hydroxyacylglutathione hydrolase
VAPERTEELARAQYRSLHRLAGLDPATALWPTHGGGSFCSTSAGPTGATTTIGDELATNELLRAPDEDTFVRLLLGTLGSHPPYFHRLGEVNRRGPEVLTTEPLLEALRPTAIADLVAAGAEVVDVRPVASFAQAHPAGALSIPLRAAFASWLGWLAPHDRPLVVLRDDEQDAEVLWQALKIDYPNIVGEIAGGIDAWQAAGLPTAAIDLVSPTDMSGVQVLDIRQHSEYTAGHLPGAAHLELGDVAEHAAEYTDGPVVVMCGHGERAMSAASLLARAGAADVRVLDGGPDDVARTLDLELEQGP